MIYAICVGKKRNNHRSVVSYTLIDTMGCQVELPAKRLKQLMLRNEIRVSNLRFSSDNRIIDCTPTVPKIDLQGFKAEIESKISGFNITAIRQVKDLIGIQSNIKCKNEPALIRINLSKRIIQVLITSKGKIPIFQYRLTTSIDYDIRRCMLNMIYTNSFIRPKPVVIRTESIESPKDDVIPSITEIYEELEACAAEYYCVDIINMDYTNKRLIASRIQDNLIQNRTSTLENLIFSEIGIYKDPKSIKRDVMVLIKERLADGTFNLKLSNIEILSIADEITDKVIMGIQIELEEQVTESLSKLLNPEEYLEDLELDIDSFAFT